MITDNERREVARKLRGLPIDMYSTIDEWEKDGLFINSSVSDEGDYSQIHDAVFGYFPAEYMHPGDYEELHERLADLIDRPTCEMTECSIDNGSRSWGMRCSRCGTEFEHEKPVYGWRYCPNCGAEVEDEV
ncbi:hypothetical protein [Collinsella sp. HCP28S3_H5]|uniref:hypothetical protein n=1 Tax=Collinsella sp. HCP28S3_H5 TaxID=3438928 RepID=UPI003F8C93C8